MRHGTPVWAAVLLACATVAAGKAEAQEIEPRAFSPSPVGVTFFLAAAGRSTGGVLTDPSLPVDDVEAEIDVGALGFGHSFGLFGRTASAAIVLPYVSGDFTGTLNGENAEAQRSGLGDTKMRLSVNLLGNPAMTPAEFAQRRPKTTIGASLSISAPTGEYYPARLVNVGTNRWAIKPEIGVSHPLGRWTLEATAGVWLFEDNDDFFGGRQREQDPLASIQAHVGYTFRPRLWLAFNATFYEGGESTIDGAPRDDRQSNSRYGLTLSVPLGRSQSLKLHWNDGATTRIGSDFTSYGIAWQYTLIPD
jgi:hypothetical protein